MRSRGGRIWEMISRAFDPRVVELLPMDKHARYDEAAARSFDEQDPLARFRERFYRQDDAVYLDGNSLGLLSTEAEDAVLDALESWKRHGVRGWLEADPAWFTLGEALGARMAPLVGAESSSVVATGTTTVNLHQLMATFYRPRSGRRKIIATSLDFPSDVYALKSQIQLHGGDPTEDLVLVPSHDGRIIEEDELISAMTDEVAVAWLPSVLYRSGQLLDIPRLVDAAHAHGILIGFDCAHSAGAVPHDFDRWGVDFAVWCTYKYLNAGPGAVGALYVNRRHWGTAPALAGWWGYQKERQFEMSHEWEGAPDAGAYQISTIPMLSAAAMLGSLSVFEEAGLEAIRDKSLAMTDFLVGAMQSRGLLGQEYGYAIGTPLERDRRGGHIAVEHDHAAGIAAALIERGVIVDFRKPNVVRLAPVALYTSFLDLSRAVEALAEIVESGSYVTGGPARPVT